MKCYVTSSHKKNPLRNAVDFQMMYACFIFRLPTEFLVRFRR